MSNDYPILRSLDPYHARIGYVGALASVATRGLDRQDALMARYSDLLYERIFQDDPRYEILLDRVDESRRQELLGRRRRPEGEDPSAGFVAAPTQVEVPPDDWLLTAGKQKRPQPKLVETDWLYISEFWLYDQQMPAHLGFLPREKADRTLDLARWSNVLLPTLELSEVGYLLQHFLGKARNDSKEEAFNLLNPSAHPCLPPLYFRLMLCNELLFPYLINELVDRHDNGLALATRGEHGLLLSAVNRMLGTIGDVTDPDNIMEMRGLTDFQTSISRKESTHENYLRPRMEILVDLGLIGRKSGKEGKRADFMWEVTGRTRLLAAEMQQLMKPNHVVRDYLDANFFESWARVHGGKPRKVTSDDEILFWFAKAFQEIGREFGFTPGRTLALKTCLAAWQAGASLEVNDVFRVVYEAAKSRWGQYLRFSGGSRFDAEFLIRMDDAMLQELEREFPCH